MHLVWLIYLFFTTLAVSVIIIDAIHCDERECPTRGDMFLMLFLALLPIANAIIVAGWIGSVIEESKTFPKIRKWLSQPIRKKNE